MHSFRKGLLRLRQRSTLGGRSGVGLTPAGRLGCCFCLAGGSGFPSGPMTALAAVAAPTGGVAAGPGVGAPGGAAPGGANPAPAAVGPGGKEEWIPACSLAALLGAPVAVIVREAEFTKAVDQAGVDSGLLLFSPVCWNSADAVLARRLDPTFFRRLADGAAKRGIYRPTRLVYMPKYLG